MILISSILPSSERWNSVSHKVIIPLVSPWLSSRRQPEILKTSPPHPLLGILKTSPYVSRTDTPHTHILCGPRMVRLPARNQEQAWKDSTLAVGVYAPNEVSTAHKDLSLLTCFNSDRKGHYATKCPMPKKNRGYSRMSSATKFRASNTLPPSEKNLC